VLRRIALLAIAAPYFALIGGLLGLLAVGAFVPDLTQDDAFTFLLLFEAAGLFWVITKLIVNFVTARHSTRSIKPWFIKAQQSQLLPIEAQHAYAKLGISPTCTPPELHQAWRNAVKSCHPDRVGRGREDVSIANVLFFELKTAYEICRRRIKFQKIA